MATAAATGSNTKQLRENLANYEAQLQQVEAALTNDPENEELLKLKTDLSDVLKLTQDLLQMAPEPKKKEKSSLSYEWKQGDPCRAVWTENGKHYNAVIDMIADDGETCSVTFDGYGTTVIVKLSELRPQGWDEEDPDERLRKRRHGLQGGKNSKQRRQELQELKKKKALKKHVRLSEIEQFREHEKQRWKDFTHKSGKARSGPLNGKQKKSIFAVPDSVSGRVGVGTCNIGGKGMTDFSNPKNYARQ